MRMNGRNAALLAGIAVAACSPDGSRQPARNRVAADTARPPATARNDSARAGPHAPGMQHDGSHAAMAHDAMQHPGSPAMDHDAMSDDASHATMDHRAMKHGGSHAGMDHGAMQHAGAHAAMDHPRVQHDASHAGMDHSGMDHSGMRRDSSHHAMNQGVMQHDTSHAAMHHPAMHPEMEHDSSHAGMQHAGMQRDTSDAGMQHAGMQHDTSHAGMEHAGMQHDTPHAGMEHGAMGHEGEAGKHSTPSDAHADMNGMAMEGGHAMPMLDLGGGWMVMAMAQAHPIVTVGAPGLDGSPLRRTQALVTQPAAMMNVESRGSRFVLRTTVDLEGLTMPEGELTYGGWGEGFIDKRHPHTLLHEAMLSANFWSAGPGSLSLSAGKGFAPYGTDDPMSRPAVKYPTNHHLSQVLERWTVNGIYDLRRWTVEAGVFAGAEPEDPYDLGNWRGFGRSWSARVTRKLGGDGVAWTAPWELSASYASVRESDAGPDRLANAAVRHQQRHALGDLYALAEASWREPDEGNGWYALLGEAELRAGRHQPYYRVELSTRPEYARRSADGDGFFRYDHDSQPIGATRWLINTAGYRYDLTRGSFAGAPFVEVQHGDVRRETGTIDPGALFGAGGFWSITTGMRIFLGGGPMRMGAYGVRDDMTRMHRGMESGMQMDHVPHAGGTH
jgi:hypothetical protein